MRAVTLVSSPRAGNGVNTRAGRTAVALLATAVAVAGVWPVAAASETAADAAGVTLGELDESRIELPGRLADSFDARRPHHDHHLVVRLKAGFEPEMVFAERHSAVVGRWWQVDVVGGAPPAIAAAAMARRPGVDIVDLSYYINHIEPAGAVSLLTDDGGISTTATPNDPFFGLQWNFPAIQLPQAWQRSGGAGSVVAVLDTGIVPAGQTFDLGCHSYVSEYNAHTNTSGSGSAPDTDGHGTHVSGTVAQCTDNGVGVAGVARDARLMPIDVFDTANPPAASSAALSRGIRWAADRGVEVINMSLGTGPECAAPCDIPIVSDAIAYAAARDVVIVAASGNDANSTLANHFPANHPEVIAVGATEFRNLRAPYSNYGNGLDLVAPGGDVTADRNGDGFVDGIVQETLTSACPGATPGPLTVFCFWQGTSMATPHVAGAVALMRSAVPGANRNQVRMALQQTARDLGAAGYDPVYGYGLLQVDDAIAYLQASSNDIQAPTWPSGASIEQVDRSGSSVTADWPDALDNVGVVGYRVSLDGAILGTVVDSGATVTGLEPVTLYQLSVRALDAAGNASPALTATVGTGGDNDPPTWSPDSTLSAVDVFKTRALVQWSRTATDFSGIAAFLVYAGPFDGATNTVHGSLVAEVAASEDHLELVGLLAATDYGVWVEARDNAGNVTQDGPIVVFTTAPDFSDIASSVFGEDIEWLAGAGVTRGCNPPVNDRFCPNDPVTRGQMAAFLVRALGLPVPGGDFFGDDGHSVFEADINALAARGITQGCNPPINDRFCPDVTLSREQMASFLVRALQLETTTGAMAFSDTAHSVHVADIEVLADSGITRGCNPPANDRFCPRETVTRGQMAAFLRRALGGLR